MSSSNVSSVNNYFATANEGFTTTLNGSISASATSVPLTSVVGLTNGTVFVGIVDPGQTAEQTFTGTVDTGGSQITGVVWTRGTDVGHAGGATVVDYVTGTSHNMTTAGTLVHADQDGTLKAGAVDVAAVLASNVVTTAKILDGNVTTAKIADDAVTAAKLDGIDKSLLTTDSNPYKFSVYRNAAQNSGSSAFAIINFDTKVFDTNSNVDIVTNVGRYTAPVNGFYWFSGRASMSVSITLFQVALYKNGAEIMSGSKVNGATEAGGMASVVSGILQLTAGDYIEVYDICNGAGALDVGSAINNGFQGFLMSRT